MNRTYPKWHELPLKLTSEEIARPQLVLSDFFACYSIVNVRQELEQLLQVSLEERATNRPAAVVHLVNMFTRLAEAALLIHQQGHQNNDNMNLHPSNLAAPGQSFGDFRQIQAVYCYGYRLKTDGQWSVFSWIGEKPDIVKDQIDLLVLISGPLDQNIITKKAEEAYPGVMVNICVQKASVAFNLIGYGNNFFSRVYAEGLPLFCRRQYIGPAPDERPAAGEPLSPQLLHKAEMFYKGAEFYFTHLQEYNFCAYNCHQAAERALFELLYSATGLKVQSHNLFYLISLTRNFTKQIADLTTGKEMTGTMEHLGRSYSEARFNSKFATTPATAEKILSFTGTLLKTVSALLQQ